MERKANQKIQSYIDTFKASIIQHIQQSSISLNEQTMLLEQIQTYPGLQLENQDFKKRKRIKNQIPLSERCCAKRADGEQCTRKKKDTHFCGTHMKGIPHGSIDMELAVPNQITKIDVWVEDIKGIMYYLDKNNNVYKPEDIVNNKHNPDVIAHWRKENDEYVLEN